MKFKTKDEALDYIVKGQMAYTNTYYTWWFNPYTKFWHVKTKIKETGLINQ